MDKDFLYGLDKLVRGEGEGTEVGYISEEGIDWGGEAATKTKIFAAQLKTAPVVILKGKDATNVLTFKMIQMSKRDTVMGTTSVIEDTFKIVTDSGHTVTIPKGVLTAEIRGKINGTELLSVNCELEMVQTEKGKLPYEITEPTIV